MSRAGALIGILLIGMLPLQDAQAQRARRSTRAPVAKAKQNAAPIVGTALALAGTYALTSVNGRPVRDGELAKSKVTISQRGDVSVQTACNGLGTRLQSRATSHHTLGFAQVIATQMGCPPKQSEAEATSARLFADTANIARAGNHLTFFNASGMNIAQWTAVPASLAPNGETSAPQPGAPAPARVSFGDYVVTQVDGYPIAIYPAQMSAPPAALDPNTRLVSSLPTLFLRDSNRVTGSSGCNQYNSTLIIAPGGQKRFGAVVSSKRACLDRGTRNIESAFFNAMRAADNVEVSASTIDIFAANGNRTVRLSAIGDQSRVGTSLYGQTWVLRRFNDTIIRQSDPPTLTFRGNQASGTTGCSNQFAIQHDRENGRSRFSNGTMTETGCSDAHRNDLQIRFVEALERITIIDITSSTLTLRSQDGRTILVFDGQ